MSIDYTIPFGAVLAAAVAVVIATVVVGTVIDRVRTWRAGRER